MAKNINQLDLKPDTTIEGVSDLEGLPEYGGFTPDPPPGFYGFKAPVFKLTDSVWDVIPPSENRPSERIALIFEGDFALQIVHASTELGKKWVGEPYETRVSNVERKRDKEGIIIASEMDYLLRAVGQTKRPSPPTNQNYATAVAKFVPAQYFGADLEYSYFCSPRRDAQIPDGAGGYTSAGRKGCGTRYYQAQVTKLPDGSMPERIQCQCGAHVRGFSQPANIKPWKPTNNQ